MADSYRYSTNQIPIGLINTKLVQYNVKLSTNNQTPTGSIEVTDGVNFEIEVGQYSNNAFTKLHSKTIKVPMSPLEVATVAVITKDSGTNVEITVRFFNRSNLNKWETTFTISKMVGVAGGIGIYSEEQSEFDNLTIMYNKS